MSTERFQVPDMSCQHCVRSITSEVSAVPGVENVQVALDSKVVTVAHNESVTTAAIVAAINEAGFNTVNRID
jgi:copper chaperone